MGLVWELYAPTLCAPGDKQPFRLWASAHKPVVLCLLFIYFYLFCLFATGSRLLLRAAGVPIY